MQEAKTRWTHYCIASHFVWISKDRRQMLTGEVQQATKELMAECCQRHDLKLLGSAEVIRRSIMECQGK